VNALGHGHLSRSQSLESFTGAFACGFLGTLVKRVSPPSSTSFRYRKAVMIRPSPTFWCIESSLEWARLVSAHLGWFRPPSGGAGLAWCASCLRIYDSISDEALTPAAAQLAT